MNARAVQEHVLTHLGKSGGDDGWMLVSELTETVVLDSGVTRGQVNGALLWLHNGGVIEKRPNERGVRGVSPGKPMLEYRVKPGVKAEPPTPKYQQKASNRGGRPGGKVPPGKAKVPTNGTGHDVPLRSGTRDPRIDPRPGDVLDDDPPLLPLEVTSVTDARVVAARYTAKKAQSRGWWDGSLVKWRREMTDARVKRVASKAAMTEE